MEEFVNTIDLQKFASTNGAWNDLMLNDPWSVGYVTTLIELKQFKTKEEWEIFYYTSGKERDAKIEGLSLEQQEIVNDYTLARKGKSYIYTIPWNLKNLNYQFGRTPEQLNVKARELFERMKALGKDITYEECCECIRFRVICETWNGVICREHNTVQKLKEYFPNIELIKVSGEIDYEYAVDYEAFYNGKLVCAIQIKPESYFNGSAQYLVNARNANQRKNSSYTLKTQVPVFNIKSTTLGKIKNPEILKEIGSILK